MSICFGWHRSARTNGGTGVLTAERGTSGAPSPRMEQLDVKHVVARRLDERGRWAKQVLAVKEDGYMPRVGRDIGGP